MRKLCIDDHGRKKKIKIVTRMIVIGILARMMKLKSPQLMVIEYLEFHHDNLRELEYSGCCIFRFISLLEHFWMRSRNEQMFV